MTKEETIDDKNIKIKLWDSAEQEKYHTLTHNYYKKCDGIIIVFDVSNRESFDKINYWVKAIHDNKDSTKIVKQVIVGNKIDLEKERQISKEEGEKMASSYSLKYFETSAKENIGINEFMSNLIADILKEKDNAKNENNENVKMGKGKQELEEEEKKLCIC